MVPYVMIKDYVRNLDVTVIIAFMKRSVSRTKLSVTGNDATITGNVKK